MRLRLATLFVLAAAVLVAGCPDDPPESDAGIDGGTDADPPALLIELGERDDSSFVAFTDEQPTLEVVSGFQGGYHIEPALRMDGVEAGEFISVVSYRVTDVETGEVLTSDPTSYRINQRAWNHQPDVGYVRVWEQVILSNVIDPDDAAGRVVELEVDVEVEGGLGYGSDSVSVLLVNEINELQ